MRSFDASNEYDVKELKRLNPPEWMIECLNLNPEYVYWGPGEDYMKSSESEGWDCGVEFEDWASFAFKLDDLNECVNFYFQIVRPARRCGCKSGYSPEVADYSPGWYEATEDDWKALVEAGRYKEPLQKRGAGGFFDLIDDGILKKAYAKRLGVSHVCSECQGHAEVFTDSECQLSLVLWFLHPRKGASRGVRVNQVEREDLPAVRKYLRQAAERNAARFSKV